MNSLYHNIKRRRKELGLTHDDLAEMMGYKARQSIIKIENGQADLPLSKIQEFARVLNTTVSALVGLDSPDENCDNDKLQTLARKLRENEFDTDVFSTKEQAVDYILRRCAGKTVGLGDSGTFSQMGLLEKLKISVGDQLYACHTHQNRDTARKAITADVFILSANAISYETGDIVNMSSRGSRIAGSLYYPDEIIFVSGRNRILPNLAEAINFVRNVGSPQKSAEYGLRTPCASSGKCEDCKSPDRLCRIMCVYFRKPKLANMSVILVDEDLGY